MANQYYLKEKKFSIWEYTTVYIKGVAVKKYVAKYRKIWTYYRHNGSSAAIEGSAIKIYDENASAIFVTNRREVEHTDIIVYNHKIYEITRIDDYEGYSDDLKILAKLAENQRFSSYNGLEDD